MADSVEEVVYNYLTTDSAFMANFSAVYQLEAPKSATAPYIVFWLIDDTGEQFKINTAQQGEARIQFDIWDTSQIRITRLRGVVRTKVKALDEVYSGYRVFTTGITENTIQRESTTDPFHQVVDGLIRWNEE